MIILAMLSLAACSSASDAGSGENTATPSADASEPTTPKISLSVEPSQSTNDVSSEPPSSSQSEDETESDNPNEVIIAELREKGLLDWQIKSLAQMGFSFEAQLEMSMEEIAVIFARGSNLVYGMEYSAEEISALKEHGIDDEQIAILRGLGYEYDDMMQLTEEQLDFIFPNTELVDNLVDLGYARESVEYEVNINESGYNSYKELLDEVFAGDALDQTLDLLSYSEQDVDKCLAYLKQSLSEDQHGGIYRVSDYNGSGIAFHGGADKADPYIVIWAVDDTSVMSVIDNYSGRKVKIVQKDASYSMRQLNTILGELQKHDIAQYVNEIVLSEDNKVHVDVIGQDNAVRFNHFWASYGNEDAISFSVRETDNPVT
jgi:hypothetical protein